MSKSRGKRSKDGGLFITFEGGDGVGKSTHISFLACDLKSRGYDVLCVREPGGTKIGEQLRRVVLDKNNTSMTDKAELLIYEAARAQIVFEQINPALEQGRVVLCDRFIDSTIAYQSFGRGLPNKSVRMLNEFVCSNLFPDRTILLTHDDTLNDVFENASKKDDADRLEQEGSDFHDRVNKGFISIAKNNPDRVRVVYADAKHSNTCKKIYMQLCDLFTWMSDCTNDDDYFDSLNDADKRASIIEDVRRLHAVC